jgi:hypothetical protein
MNCCHAQKEPSLQRSWWRSVGGCLGSGTLLVVLPKCPLCIAAYLTVWAGASIAMPLAAYLRPAVGVVFAGSVLLLLARGLVTRLRISSRDRTADASRAGNTSHVWEPR